VIGPEPVIAVELTAVVEADPDRARQVAHGWARHYLELPNYARNLERMGFTTDELRGEGSPRVIDATVAWGDVDAVASRVREHLDAGADHVCVQFVAADETDLCAGDYRDLVSLVPA
jgi:probable F420-dependent oxidoreductase